MNRWEAVESPFQTIKSISSRALRYTASVHDGDFVVYSLTFCHENGDTQHLEGLWFTHFQRFGVAVTDDVAVWMPATSPQDALNNLYVAPPSFP